MSIDPGQRVVAERLDALPVTALHLWAIALCSLGFAFDLLEMALGSALSAVFTAVPDVASPRQLSWLLASVYVGAVVGAPLLGRAADRFGRRSTLVAVLLWLGVFSLLGAFSRDIDQLTVYRGVSGIALGAYPPLMIAYLTDLLPPARRGMLVFCTIALAALGPTAGIFLVRALTPIQPLGLEAWRWGFVLGGVGALGAGAAFIRLPESPRWLESRGRTSHAWRSLERFERSRVCMAAVRGRAADPRGRSTARQVADEGAAPRRGVRFALLFLLSPWSTVAFPLLTGAVLTSKGFGLSDTLLFVGLSTFGPLVGTVLAAGSADRFDRRLVLSVCAVAMAGCGLGFVQADASGWLVACSVGFSVFASLYVSVLNVYRAELAGTTSRASAIAGAWTMNRIGAFAAPFVLLPLLGREGATSMFLVIAATLGASVVLLLAMPKGRQQQGVD